MLMKEKTAFRKAKEKEIVHIVKQFNESMVQHERTYQYSCKEAPREEEDLFSFYQNNLNEANQKIKQLQDAIKEYREVDLKLMTKDRQIKSLCYTIDEKINENAKLKEQVDLLKKENSMLYTNISQLKEEIKKVSWIDNNFI